MASRRSNQGWRGPCEAGVAINDQFGKPLIQYCSKPGKWFPGGFLFGLVLCEDHEDLKDRVDTMAMAIGELRAKKRGAQYDPTV